METTIDGETAGLTVALSSTVAQYQQRPASLRQARGGRKMSLKQEFELLRRVPIFAEIEPSKLKLLAFMSERVGFDPGKRLMQQGDPADAAYLIIEGHADVILETSAGSVIVATIGANEIVGDMGILGNRPRAATVCAKDRVVALRISKEPFMRMVREFPNMAVSIMQELAQRLEATNNQLRAALVEIKRLRETAGIAA
jgi:CRP-like cAMP-binding protein